MKILVIGESCRDVFNYGVCDRLCPEAPVPVFNPSHSTENGGMASNVYRNVLALDVEAHLFTNENWKSLTKTRFIDFRSNHMFMRYDIGDGSYGRSDLSKIKYNKYDAIIISDYDKGFLTESNIEEISTRHECTFLDTKKVLGNWCKKIKFIKINNYEYDKTKHSLSSEIEKKLIITMGSNGCKYRGVEYPVPEVEIKDASGAGDTFISGLAVKFVHTKDIKESIIFANQCATTVVQKRGVNTI